MEAFHYSELPDGVCPTQARGQITSTGETFCFRYRHGYARLDIFHKDCSGGPETIKSSHGRPVGHRTAGYVPEEQATKLIGELLAEYLGQP